MVNRLEALAEAVERSPLATPKRMETMYRLKERRIRQRRVAAGSAAIAALAIVGVVAGVTIGRGPRSTVVASQGGNQLNVLPLFKPGSVTPMLLTDGTPVWEVRPQTGPVEILAGWSQASEGPTFPVSGVNVLTAWIPGEHIFVGQAVYDDQGRFLGVPRESKVPTSQTGPSLGYYDATTSGQTVIVGSYHSGQQRIGVRPSGMSSIAGYPVDQTVTFDRLLNEQPHLSADQAQALPRNTLSVVDATMIIAGPGPARVCGDNHRADTVPFPACPSSAALIDGVTSNQRPSYTLGIAGPLLLRTGKAGFTSVIVTGMGYSQYAR